MRGGLTYSLAAGDPRSPCVGLESTRPDLAKLLTVPPGRAPGRGMHKAMGKRGPPMWIRISLSGRRVWKDSYCPEILGYELFL